MLITILAGAFILSVVIIVHEFGHFIVAKKLGVFVKVFSVGFGRKVLKKRSGDTVYAISALPFGGYVKFAGETESGDSKEAPQGQPADEVPDSEIDPARYFVNKRPLVRSAVVFAGPFSNYLLAVIIYITMFSVLGLPAEPETTTVGILDRGSPADSAGLAVNDRILEVGGDAVKDWDEVVDAVWKRRDGEVPLRVLRGADTVDVRFRCVKQGRRVQLGFDAYIAPIVGRVKRDGPAYRAGMRSGALVEAINDTAVTTFYDIERFGRHNPKVPLVVRWSLDGIQHQDTIVPVAKKVLKEDSKTEFEIVGQIGVGARYRNQRVPLHRAVAMSFESTTHMIGEIVSFFGLLVTGRAGVDALGGPILITQMAGDMARWGFNNLMYFLAFFSINLCIFNLLPLLPFDGGHLTLFFYEGLTRRRVNRRLRELLGQAGFVLVILLMIFVVVLDLSRCVGSSPVLF
jgi:regulator of sigma E protease